MAYFRCQQGSSSGGAGATITVTYNSSFYNKTMTCTKGSTTYTKTTTSSGSTTFNVNEEGTWTITCNGVSRTVNVVLSYNTQMAITKTVTVYGAASDTVSFTDVTGAKTVTTDTSGQGSVSISFIPNSTITFTSSYAKNPSDTSQAYSKTITMTDSVTTIYIMPSGHIIYWYGYNPYNSYIQTYATLNNVEYSGGGYTGLAPTVNRNTRDLEFTLAGSAKGGAWIFNTSLPFSSYSNLKLYTKTLSVGSSSYVIPMTVANQPSVGYSPTQLRATPAIASNTVSTVPTSTLSKYIGAHHHTFNNANISFNALWLE